MGNFGTCRAKKNAETPYTQRRHLGARVAPHRLGVQESRPNHINANRPGWHRWVGVEAPSRCASSLRASAFAIDSIQRNALNDTYLGVITPPDLRKQLGGFPHDR